MKQGDRYHKWVEWVEEDGCYVGRCPDLFFGGCHGPEASIVYAELCQLVDQVVKGMVDDGEKLPAVVTRPMREVA